MTHKSPVDGARLLILGAGAHQMPVIRRAMELGCHVIAADYDPANPGHRAASESEVVSTTDLEGTLALARRHGVDGVLTYGSDVSVPAVANIAESLGLPGNAFAVASLLQRKDRIRDLQERLGLPHPRFAAAADADSLVACAFDRGLPFPLLVKPVDSSGSKGQSVARSPEELRHGFDAARPFSRCGMVIAEVLLPDDITELVCEVLIEEGRLVFGHYGHNWFCNDVHPRVPVGEMFPGTFGRSIVDEIDRQINALAAGAGVRNACMNFDALLSGGEVFLVDAGLRNGGNFVDEVVRLSSGVDLTTAAVFQALAVAPEVPSLHVQNAKCYVSQIIHAHAAGRLASIRIDGEVQPHVAAYTEFIAKGDLVRDYTRGDAGVGVLIFEQPSAGCAEELVARNPHPAVVELDRA